MSSEAQNNKRKGARSIAEIPLEILELLNRGCLETANLTEWLAVDQKNLLKIFLKENGRQKYSEAILNKLDAMKVGGASKKTQLIGEELLIATSNNNDAEILDLASCHPSDIVRCWAAIMIGSNKEVEIGAMFF